DGRTAGPWKPRSVRPKSRHTSKAESTRFQPPQQSCEAATKFRPVPHPRKSSAKFVRFLLQFLIVWGRFVWGQPPSAVHAERSSAAPPQAPWEQPSAWDTTLGPANTPDPDTSPPSRTKI